MRWFLWASLMFLAACDDKNPSPVLAESDAGVALPVDGELDFDVDGGTLTTDSGFKIEIPAGALTERVHVRVLLADALPTPGGFQPTGHVYRIEPDGYGFFAPVTLTFPRPATPVPAGQEVVAVTMGYDEGAPFVFPVEFDEATFSARSVHFSDWAIGVVPIIPRGGTFEQCLTGMKRCDTECISGLSDQVRKKYALGVPLTSIGPPTARLYEVYQPYLSPPAAGSLSNLVGASRLGPLPVGSALRTFDAQAFIKRLGVCGQAAPAGTSNHGQGNAIDLAVCRKEGRDGGFKDGGTQNPACVAWTGLLLDAGWSWGGDFTKPDSPHFYFGGDSSGVDLEVVRAFVDLWNEHQRCDTEMQGTVDVATALRRLPFAPAGGFLANPDEVPPPIDSAGHFCCDTEMCSSSEACFRCGAAYACAPRGQSPCPDAGVDAGEPDAGPLCDGGPTATVQFGSALNPHTWAIDLSAGQPNYEPRCDLEVPPLGQATCCLAPAPSGPAVLRVTRTSAGGTTCPNILLGGGARYASDAGFPPCFGATGTLRLSNAAQIVLP